MLKKVYIAEHQDFSDALVETDYKEDGKLYVRMFENQSDHITTLGWYIVDDITGKVEVKG